MTACDDLTIAKYIQGVFSTPTMRVYTNPNIEGVELCGAMKNIISIAAGISSGLGYGDNAKAALIARGMAEISGLGKKMGCLEQTSFGLAEIGDLIVTATSVHSRNNRCGNLIGQGVPIGDAVKQVGMVVEGINAIPAALELMKRYSVEMPIVQVVNAIVNKAADPKKTVLELMGRENKTGYPVLIRKKIVLKEIYIGRVLACKTVQRVCLE